MFVDANIYLDFYHFSNDDLNELKKLVDLVNKGEITLILTSQVIDEVKRNRDNKVADAYHKFQDSKISLNLPQICKSYPEFTKIMKTLDSLRKLKADLDNKLIGDINKRTLKADEIIDELFKGASVIDSSKYLEKARIRFDLGNPPGKQRSYGDALTWTSLVSVIEDKEDLFFVSDDIDYKSPLNELLFHPFLLEEWRENKKSDLFFYIKLSDFFNEHHKDIQLKVEGEKNELIYGLSSSSNYATTHSVIKRLSKYTSFTDEQIRNISKIAVDNSQVGDILGDPDVKNFYQKVLDGKEEIIESEVREAIIRGYGEDNEDPEYNCPHCQSALVKLGAACPACGNICESP